MPRSTVNIHNWRQCQDFIDFLTLEFSIDNLNAERKSLIAHLLPIAVAENRLLGAITTAILEAAIEAWNRPAAYHIFTVEKSRWKYFGQLASLTGFRHSSDETVRIVYGCLKRTIPYGAFCKRPHVEVDILPQPQLARRG